MKKYSVLVREILEREVIIDAEDHEDAEDKVFELYRNGDVVLDWADHINTEFESAEIVEINEDEEFNWFLIKIII